MIHMYMIHIPISSSEMHRTRFAKNKERSESLAKEVAKRRSSAPDLSSGPLKTSQETKMPSADEATGKGACPMYRTDPNHDTKAVFGSPQHLVAEVVTTHKGCTVLSQNAEAVNQKLELRALVGRLKRKADVAPAAQTSKQKKSKS